MNSVRSTRGQTGPMAEQVLFHIRDLIVRGEFAPGDRINVDAMARRFEVSAIPVREALRSLEAHGWVYFIARRGAFVSDRSEEGAASLLEARLIVEPQIARIASQRRTASDLQALEKLVDEGLRAAESDKQQEFVDINSLFHITLAECTQSPVLIRIYSEINSDLSLYYGATVEKRIAESAAEHEKIFQAVRDGDEALAEWMVRDHATATFNIFSTYSSPSVQ